MEQVIRTEVFVAGAGAAGIGAACAAAESGLDVFVAERNGFPGGRATASAVGTVCGLYLRSEDQPRFVMNGFPKQFAEKLISVSGRYPVRFASGLWFLPAHPSDFEKAARSFLTRDKITVQYGLNITGITKSKNRITEVYCKSGNAEVKIVPEILIDCSGEGVICAKANHRMIGDEEYQAAAIVFSMKGIEAGDEYALSLSLLKRITAHVEAGEIPQHYQLLSIIPHSLASGTVFFKMGLPWKAGPGDHGELEVHAKNLVKEIALWLVKSVSAFHDASLDYIAREVGVRTGFRAVGKGILADEDVLLARKTGDGICNGSWPVEYWRTGSRKADMTYFPENDFYTIPPGCLQSGEIANLYFAGKIISAEEKAIASARVIGTCLGTGYAAGILASHSFTNKNESDAVEHIRMKMNANP